MTDVTTGEAGEPGLSVPVPGDLLGVLVDRRRGGGWGCVPDQRFVGAGDACAS